MDQKQNQSGFRYGNDSEHAPFIRETTKPVVLTPAWEASNLPNDELNFKGMTMERAEMQLRPPHDKWKIVFFIFLLHGLGTLMPWNMFITAKSYFVDFKLEKSDAGYDTMFLQYIGFAAQVPNLLLNWGNIFANVGGDLTKRIIWSLSIEIVVFMITVAMAMMDSSNSYTLFFWGTMACVVVLNMANGVYQNTVYGMVATLPTKYTGAVVLGSNISGLFASVVSIVSSKIFETERTAAIYYFITAMFVLLLCFDTYFALPLNRYYRHNEMIRSREAELVKETDENKKVPRWEIFKQASPQLFNVFFTFFVTLAVFPAVYSDVKRSDNNFFVSEKMYASITCFLTFNLFAMIGSLLTSWVKYPGPNKLVIPVVLRAVFIPLFLFCNYHPKNTTRMLPIYITNDWIYWGIGVIMSLSSGYLSALGMMYAPQTVAGKHAVTAGMFAAAVLCTGILSGIVFSLIFPFIV